MGIFLVSFRATSPTHDNKQFCTCHVVDFLSGVDRRTLVLFGYRCRGWEKTPHGCNRQCSQLISADNPLFCKNISVTFRLFIWMMVPTMMSVSLLTCNQDFTIKDLRQSCAIIVCEGISAYMILFG